MSQIFLMMPQKKICVQCGKPFYGRANKKYCLTACKNQANNAPSLKMRRDNRFYAKVMEKNERILRAVMEDRTTFSKLIAKSELTRKGFNHHGPFVVYKGKYLVGNYYLTEKGFWYEVSMKSTFTEAGLIEELFPVKKYWDRVIGKYYAGLYENSGTSEGFPFMLSEDVELAESYVFQRIVKIQINTYKKNGKLKESMMMNTHTAKDKPYMGTQIEDEESQKKGQNIFIINDFEREAFVMLMESEGEKSRLAYKLLVDEAALAEAEAEMEADNKGEEMPNFEPLGTKTIMGYTCKGYGYNQEDGYTEIWVTDEDVFDMQNMFNINQSTFEKNMGSLPEDYPKGSVMELSTVDAESQEKMVMQVVDIIDNVDVNYTIADYPQIGSTPTE